MQKGIDTFLDISEQRLTKQKYITPSKHNSG
jgi:hypothetical protein